jgi:hypothetical protein
MHHTTVRALCKLHSRQMTNFKLHSRQMTNFKLHSRQMTNFCHHPNPTRVVLCPLSAARHLCYSDKQTHSRHEIENINLHLHSNCYRFNPRQHFHHHDRLLQRNTLHHHDGSRDEVLLHSSSMFISTTAFDRPPHVSYSATRSFAT